MIKLVGITKTYVSKKYRKTAVNDVSYSFNSSGFYCICGKSGCGKTTLLNLISGMDKPSSGKILVNDKDLSSFTNSQLDDYRSACVGVVFQNFNLMEDYTVYENLSIALELLGENEAIIDSKVSEILDSMNLQNIAYKYPNKLSGGEKQRVAIARALIKKPSILLIDEPTGNLDKENAKNIMEILKKISKEKLVIMVSHNEREVKKYGDVIIKLDNGKIIDKIENKVLENKIENQLKMKKSKLSVKKILVLAVSNIKKRKYKFISMILLVSLILSFFGISLNFLLYNHGEVAYKTFDDNNVSQINYIRHKEVCDGEGFLKACWEETWEVTREDVKKLKEIFPNTQINYLKPTSLYLTDEGDYDENNPYYNNKLEGIVYVEDFSKIEYELIGNIPTSNDEIIISEYLAEMLIKFYYTDLIEEESGIKYLINKYLFPINNISINMQIVGIYKDSHIQYEKLKEIDKKSVYFKQLLNNFDVARKTMYSLIYVKEDFQFDRMVSEYSIPISTSIQATTKSYGFKILSSNWSKINVLGNSKNIITRETEVIVDLHTFAEIFRLSKEEVKNNPNIVNEYLGREITLSYESGVYTKKNKSIKLTIVGVDEYETGIYLHTLLYDKLYDEMVAMNEWLYPSVMIGINGEKNDVVYLLNEIEKLDYIHNTDFSEMLTMSSKFFNECKNMFLVISIILAIFSCLLVYSMTKSTILDRKKDIGILRSLGVSKFGVSKMFILQSFFVSLVTSLLSMSITSSFVTMLNKIFSGNFVGQVTILLNSSFSMWMLLITNILFINLFCLLALIKYLIRMPIKTINEE